MGIDVMTMNNYGCSLIWGHPQGPTGMRAVIELIEELIPLGGGYGLFHGCAAGDTAMAVVYQRNLIMGQVSSDLPVVFPSVVHALVDAAAKSPGQEALVMGEERLNYREYLRCVAGFSRELETLGLNGCRVALLMGNSIDVCIAMFAIHAARAEAVPLNPVYTARELLPMLEDAEVAAIIYDEPFDAMVRSLAAELKIRHLLAIGAGRRLTEWRGCQELDTLGDLPAGEDPATLQFTGGTTGRAKGACISHYSLSVNVSQREAISPHPG